MLGSVQQYLVKRKDWFLNYRDVVEQTLNTYTFTMTSLVPDLRCFILAFTFLRCTNQEAVCPAPQQSESEPGPGNGPD